MLLSGIITWISLWYVIPKINSRFMDKPNSRSSHKKSMPTSGGLSFIISALSISLLMRESTIESNILVMVYAMPIACVGLIDDMFDLPAKWRYICQVANSILIVTTSQMWMNILMSNHLEMNTGLAVIAVTLIIGSTVIINSTNFMDGLDGLVGGCMIIIFSTAAFHQISILPLVGGLIGFLIWNWNPAKIFMGDVGSTFLGAVLVGVIINENTVHEAIGIFLVSVPLLADACICVPRRLLARQNIFKAHRSHLFQRLHQAGWSHKRVAILYMFATLIQSITYLNGKFEQLIIQTILIVMVGIWVDSKIAVKFHEVK